MEANTNIAKNTILETLSLRPSTSETSKDDEILFLDCIFCDHAEKLEVNRENKAILQHMFMEHRLVISDVQEVLDLREYLRFWKSEFQG